MNLRQATALRKAMDNLGTALKPWTFERKKWYNRVSNEITRELVELQKANGVYVKNK